MSKKRKKKLSPPLFLSPGPLPERWLGRFPDVPLVFCDASQRRVGGLAAVMYADSDDVPCVSRRTVPLAGSTHLEYLALLLGVAEGVKRFPGVPIALFSDNQDAVSAMELARQNGAVTGLDGQRLDDLIAMVRFFWIKGHSTCRGNALADQYAREAAI